MLCMLSHSGTKESMFSGRPNPNVPVHIYMDVEGDPEQGFDYLVGIIVVQGENEQRFSFWADNRDDEDRIFEQFLATVTQYKDFRVFAYGGYERAFLMRMRKRAKRKCPWIECSRPSSTPSRSSTRMSTSPPIPTASRTWERAWAAGRTSPMPPGFRASSGGCAGFDPRQGLEAEVDHLQPRRLCGLEESQRVPMHPFKKRHRQPAHGRRTEMARP